MTECDKYIDRIKREQNPFYITTLDNGSILKSTREGQTAFGWAHYYLDGDKWRYRLIPWHYVKEVKEMYPMRITAIRMETELVQRPDNRLIACGSMEFNHQLRIEYIRVVKTVDGRFLVCMPSLVNNASQHRDTVHPTDPDLRKQINESVMAEVKKLLFMSRHARHA